MVFGNSALTTFACTRHRIGRTTSFLPGATGKAERRKLATATTCSSQPTGSEATNEISGDWPRRRHPRRKSHPSRRSASTARGHAAPCHGTTTPAARRVQHCQVASAASYWVVRQHPQPGEHERVEQPHQPVVIGVPLGLYPSGAWAGRHGGEFRTQPNRVNAILFLGQHNQPLDGLANLADRRVHVASVFQRCRNGIPDTLTVVSVALSFHWEHGYKTREIETIGRGTNQRTANYKGEHINLGSTDSSA